MTNISTLSDPLNQPNPGMAPDELILLMGGPGSGKGTTGEVLARQLGAQLRSTGQLMREDNDPVIMAHLDKGDLAPEAEIERVLTSAILNLKGQPLILDGATKKPNEAKWLLSNLAKFGRRLTVVIYLEVDEDLARQRILSLHRGRDDDAPEFQEHRWHEFRTHTLQSIDIYRQAGLLEAVNVDTTPEKIVRQMLSIIARRQQA